MRALKHFQEAQARLLKCYDVDAESRFLEVPSVSGHVHVLVCGDGPAVVMVPGFADPAALWAPLISKLDEFKIYAVDRPCFGLTGRVEHRTDTFRKLAVNFIEQVLDALELERPFFIGNSIGSLWCIWLALDRPDRVSAMVHIGCPAFILGTSAPLPMRLLSIRPLGRLLMKLSPPSPRQVEKFAEMVGEDLSEVPEVRGLLVSAQKIPGVQPAILNLLHAVVRLRGARPELALTEDQLSQIQQPVQLIWGENDAFGSPDIGEAATRIISDAELHVILGGGHIPWVMYAAEVAAIAKPFLRAQAKLKNNISSGNKYQNESLNQ